MKVEGTNVDAPEIIFAAHQVLNGKIDTRLIGADDDLSKVEEQIRYGWEVYGYRLVARMTTK